MKRLIIAVAVLASLLVAAGPTHALSCAPPEPIDWSRRFPELDSAFIVRVDTATQDPGLPSTVYVQATVVEVLKGSGRATLDYTVSSLPPWGPFYPEGELIAVVVQSGKISDGVEAICGPWYGPDELRDAAGRYGDEPGERPPTVDVPPQPEKPEPLPTPTDPAPLDPGGQPADFWRLLLELIRLLIGWVGLHG